MDIIGFIGSFLLTFCGIPELIRTIKHNKCYVGWTFLLMWFIGEVLMLIYVIPKNDLPLLLNYLFNSVLLSILVFYKIKFK
mgnify:CR=1 FL=1